MLTRKAENSCHAIRGFTLVELLVVIAILSILVAVFMPTLCRAREIARKRVCQTRLKDIHTAAMQRQADWLGYAAQPDARNCWVITKEQMIDPELETGACNWGTAGGDHHYWLNDYALNYMGQTGPWNNGYGTAFKCPSQSDELFNYSAWRADEANFKHHLMNSYGVGYGVTSLLWERANFVPLPGGKFLVNEHHRSGDPRHVDRTYVRGLHAASNLVAFADATGKYVYSTTPGFRHDMGGGYQNWIKNVVFWDGHVGDQEILTHVGDYSDPYWYAPPE
jgi:prepilin-type N-terminal cleavage/methylation domain-containing protein/prepilin-type processing-associated H-X9-DG protein